MRRIYQELIHEHLSSLRQMVFLMGPRQVGKTTLSLEAASEWPKHFYFNWDNPAERLLFLEGSEAIAEQASAGRALTDPRRGAQRVVVWVPGAAVLLPAEPLTPEPPLG